MTFQAISCRGCAHFAQGNGSKMALGSCMSIPHDGHTGQWPFKFHTCRSYRPLSDANSTKNDEPSEGIAAWVCMSCRDHAVFKQHEFRRHFLEVHGFEQQGVKGQRSLISHVDFRDQSINIYAWEIAGIHAVQIVCVPRRSR